MGKVAESKPHKESKGSSLGRIIHDTRYKIPREKVLKIRITGNLSMNHLSSITFKTTAKKKRQY
jgi:hypothetical protein